MVRLPTRGFKDLGTKSTEDAKSRTAKAILGDVQIKDLGTSTEDANSRTAKAILGDVQMKTSLIKRGSIVSIDSAPSSLQSNLGRHVSHVSDVSTMSADTLRSRRRGWASSCFPQIFSNAAVGIKDGDDDSDSSVGEESSEYSNPVDRRLQRMHSVYSEKHENNLILLRSRVREKLGLPDEGKPWPLWLRIQWCLGILYAREAIGVKRLRVEEEPPDFPGARQIVASLRFEAGVGVMIFVNAAMIGWDTMFSEGEAKPWMLVISENLFTLIFVVEFCMRIMAYSWVWIFDPMNIFDAFVVWIVGVLTTWILVPAGVDVDIVQRMAALRILRLARLCRAIRMIPVFHELWMLVKGVMECMPLLFWAGVIIGTVHFMFAVAVMELVLKTDAFKDDPEVEKYFGSLYMSMFTLFQIMTFDSWATIVRPIIFKEPTTALLFFSFIGIAGIVLFNLMTAIVVKNSFDALAEDEEAVSNLKHMEHIRVQQELLEMFRDMDDDHNGMLSESEFTDVLDDASFVRKMKLMDIDLEELPDVFEILDDGDGMISMDEFCTGLMRMQGVAMSRDMLKATQRMKRINEGFTEVKDDLRNVSDETSESIEDALQSSHQNFLEIQALTAEVLKKLNQIGIRKVLQASTKELPKLEEPTWEDIVRESKEQHETNADLSHQANMVKPIPPKWIARRREEQRKQRRETVLKSVLRSKPDEAEKQEPDTLAGVPMEFREEWDDLQVRVEPPPLLVPGNAPRRISTAPARRTPAFMLPGALVPVHAAAPTSAASPTPPRQAPPVMVRPGLRHPALREAYMSVV